MLMYPIVFGEPTIRAHYLPGILPAYEDTPLVDVEAPDRVQERDFPDPEGPIWPRTPFDDCEGSRSSATTAPDGAGRPLSVYKLDKCVSTRISLPFTFPQPHNA
jgi:hypothetical protein